MLQTVKILVKNQIKTLFENFSPHCHESNIPPPDRLPNYLPSYQSFQKVEAKTSLPQSEAAAPVAPGEYGRIWGDPHFEGGDGDRFDVQGEAGKTYNLLTDTGLILNGKFEAFGKGKTVVGETGLTLSGPNGVSRIVVSSRPQAQVTINGQRLAPGQTVSTADGGRATLSADGKTVVIQTAEGYTLTQIIKKEGAGGELEIKVKTPDQGVAAEGRLPSGLLGQTFDADKMAQRSGDPQGQGAIQENYRNYEIPGGLFAEPSPDVAPQATNIHGFYQFAQDLGFSAENRFAFPEKNPLTLNTVNWATEIGQSTLEDLQRQSTRQAKAEIYSKNAQINRLTHLMFLAIQSGNITLAMMLFSHLEARSANQLTKTLMEKVQTLQERKRKLSEQIQTQKNDADGNKNIQKIKTDMEEASDDISVLQTFIRDVAQNKQQNMELANAFMTKEYETTMNIIRTFAR